MKHLGIKEIEEILPHRHPFLLIDYVRLIPNTYHNYMGYQEEGTVYELPWEYECSDDSESDLTLEQYNAIVSLAEWQDEELVKPIE